MPGIADWLAFGLPTEGKEADRPRAGDVAVRDAPTCALTDRVDDVRAKVNSAGWDSCVVVGENGVVLGRVRADDLQNQRNKQTVEPVMEAGPSTVRQSEYLDALIGRMQDEGVDDIIVTNSIGECVGVLRRTDGERRLSERSDS